MVPSTARVRDFCIGPLARESVVNAGFPLARSYVPFVRADGIFQDHSILRPKLDPPYVHCKLPSDTLTLVSVSVVYATSTTSHHRRHFGL